TVFGLIELVIFVQTVRPGDAGFDKAHLQQLFGHTLPIAAALIGLSFVSRTTAVPVGLFEFALILTLFLLGSVLRVLAVYQLGRVAFKFDIVFRDEQRLMTEKLYRLMRHPTYTAMMLVILAYARTTHSLAAGLLGLLSAWVGFQYRIHHEEKALEECFGENYRKYRAGTGMWWPRWKRAPEGEGWINEE
ncbi:MAG: methyltransferase family protein, partial [Nitrospinaceae bacterium]